MVKAYDLSVEERAQIAGGVIDKVMTLADCLDFEISKGIADAFFEHIPNKACVRLRKKKRIKKARTAFYNAFNSVSPVRFSEDEVEYLVSGGRGADVLVLETIKCHARDEFRQPLNEVWEEIVRLYYHSPQKN